MPPEKETSRSESLAKAKAETFNQEAAGRPLNTGEEPHTSKAADRRAFVREVATGQALESQSDPGQSESVSAVLENVAMHEAAAEPVQSETVSASLENVAVHEAAAEQALQSLSSPVQSEIVLAEECPEVKIIGETSRGSRESEDGDAEGPTLRRSNRKRKELDTSGPEIRKPVKQHKKKARANMSQKDPEGPEAVAAAMDVVP